jgi:hypothetical protein
MTSENQGDFEDRLDQRRAVLLRPGDLLLLGNVGTDVDMEVLGSLARCLKEDLSLSSVVIFESDVTLDSIGREEIERLMDKRKPVKGMHGERQPDGD